VCADRVALPHHQRTPCCSETEHQGFPVMDLRTVLMYGVRGHVPPFSKGLQPLLAALLRRSKDTKRTRVPERPLTGRGTRPPIMA
jgi:hypothetical protein